MCRSQREKRMQWISGGAHTRLVAHAEDEHVDEGGAGVATPRPLEHRRAAGHVPVVRQRLCHGGLPRITVLAGQPAHHHVKCNASSSNIRRPLYTQVIAGNHALCLFACPRVATAGQRPAEHADGGVAESVRYARRLSSIICDSRGRTGLCRKRWTSRRQARSSRFTFHVQVDL